MRVSKEQILTEVVNTLKLYVSNNESVFQTNLSFAVFDIDNSTLTKSLSDKNTELNKLCEENFSRKEQWSVLSKTYDYAFEGILPNGINDDDLQNGLVLKNFEMISLINSDDLKFSDNILDVTNAAFGRSRLDGGLSVTIQDIALLANVDERTVRNAISAKEIETSKLDKKISIDNKSAINWLSRRKGFNPTKFPNLEAVNFDEIKSISEFGAYLKSIRENLNIEISNQTWISKEKGIRSTDILGLEQGIFILSIDKCEALSDFYNIDRDSFLIKVMDLFFIEELELIKNSLNERGDFK